MALGAAIQGDGGAAGHGRASTSGASGLEPGPGIGLGGKIFRRRDSSSRIRSVLVVGEGELLSEHA